MNTPKDKQSKENECSDTSTCSVELEDSAWQPSSLGGRVSGVNLHTRKPTEESEQLSLWKSIPMLNSSSNITSQMFQSTQISETISPEKGNSSFYRWDFRRSSK
jgi:hypothetical protein